MSQDGFIPFLGFLNFVLEGSCLCWSVGSSWDPLPFIYKATEPLFFKEKNLLGKGSLSFYIKDMEILKTCSFLSQHFFFSVVRKYPSWDEPNIILVIPLKFVFDIEALCFSLDLLMWNTLSLHTHWGYVFFVLFDPCNNQVRFLTLCNNLVRFFYSATIWWGFLTPCNNLGRFLTPCNNLVRIFDTLQQFSEVVWPLATIWWCSWHPATIWGGSLTPCNNLVRFLISWELCLFSLSLFFFFGRAISSF